MNAIPLFLFTSAMSVLGAELRLEIRHQENEFLEATVITPTGEELTQEFKTGLAKFNYTKPGNYSGFVTYSTLSRGVRPDQICSFSIQLKGQDQRYRIDRPPNSLKLIFDFGDKQPQQMKGVASPILRVRRYSGEKLDTYYVEYEWLNEGPGGRRYVSFLHGAIPGRYKFTILLDGKDEWSRDGESFTASINSSDIESKKVRFEWKADSEAEKE
jgi:hypothetical protein